MTVKWGTWVLVGQVGSGEARGVKCGHAGQLVHLDTTAFNFQQVVGLCGNATSNFQQGGCLCGNHSGRGIPLGQVGQDDDDAYHHHDDYVKDSQDDALEKLLRLMQ